MSGMVTTLNRKLLRDLWRIRGQVLAIAIVVACGTAIFVMMNGVERSLDLTRKAYYQSYRFAELFAPVKRAPNHLAARVQTMDGVAALEARITGSALIDLKDQIAPITARVVSTAEERRQTVNELHLSSGRWLDRDRPNEAILSRDFAGLHGIDVGDRLTVTLNGQRRHLIIVGTALSPEFVYPIPPGEIVPDERRFAVIWMGYRSLANVYDLDGAFNELVLRLTPGASTSSLIDQLDHILEPYGALGAYERKDQISDHFLSNEIETLATLGKIVPSIFMLVSSFLLHVALARIVETEREEIGLIKAFGYSDAQVAWQYLKLAFVVVLIGLLIGWFAGTWMGRGLAGIYTDFFNFPLLVYKPVPAVYVISAAVTVVAASFGAVSAVRASLALTPAEAMRPQPPADYQNHRFTTSLISWDRIDQASRLILRHLSRWPRRALITVLGIALAMGIRVAAQQNYDAISFMLWAEFDVKSRYDLSVDFVDPKPIKAIRALERINGVLAVEPVRVVQAKLHNGHRVERRAIIGHMSAGTLDRVLDDQVRPLEIPETGLVLSDRLANQLEIQVGDTVTLEITEGHRPTISMPVSTVISAFIGTPAYTEIRVLNRALSEPRLASGAYLSVDDNQMISVLARLKEMPALRTVTIKEAARDAFREKMDEFLGVMTIFNTLFASLIAIGVVYNSARVSFSERSRELATLKVLGFGNLEICYVLLGEFAILTMLALPLGAIIGWGLAKFITSALTSDLFRIPMAIEPPTYGIAALTITGAAIFSGLLLAVKVSRLDMVSTSKTRE